jgi:universal stress protein A
MQFNTILVAVDFSEGSRTALAAGSELAQQCGGHLHLVHSYPCEPPIMAPYAPAIPVDYMKDLRKAAAAHLHEWREKHCPSDLEVTEHLSLRPPCETISDLATEISADLIVIGTRGLTGLKHVLLGSTAERTVRIAPCPVMTVKEA